MAIIAPVTRDDLNHAIGIAVWQITLELHDLEEKLMASVADLLAQLTAEDADIKASVDAAVQLLQANGVTIANLQAQIDALSANTTISQDQIDALNTAVTDLAASNTELQGALPPAPTEPPA